MLQENNNTKKNIFGIFICVLFIISFYFLNIFNGEENIFEKEQDSIINIHTDDISKYIREFYNIHKLDEEKIVRIFIIRKNTHAEIDLYYLDKNNKEIHSKIVISKN